MKEFTFERFARATDAVSAVSIEKVLGLQSGASWN